MEFLHDAAFFCLRRPSPGAWHAAARQLFNERLDTAASADSLLFLSRPLCLTERREEGMKGKEGELKKNDKGGEGGNGPASTSPEEDAREHPDLSFPATAEGVVWGVGGARRGLVCSSFFF